MKRIIYLLLLVLVTIGMSNAQTDNIVRKKSEQKTQQQQSQSQTAKPATKPQSSTSKPAAKPQSSTSKPATKPQSITPAKPNVERNGHIGVDLGITDAKGKTIYWATCNVGASNPWEYGHYFAWGETKGYTSNVKDGHKFDWAYYKLCKGTYDSMTKYCTDSKYGTVDGKKLLEVKDDAATAQWGGNWRMPTRSEQDKLQKECYWQWVTRYQGHSVSGYIVYKAKTASDKGKKSYNKPSLSSTYSESDSHIFLPAAGYRNDSDLYSGGSNGYYWSSSLGSGSSYSLRAYYLYFGSGNVNWSSYSRYYGRSVRPVSQ